MSTHSEQDESNYIRAQVGKEVEEQGGNIGSPIARLLRGLKDEELMFRFRVDKEGFKTKEIFEGTCRRLEIYPNSKFVERHGECYWFSPDNKTCLWCAKDPRLTEDYYPRYFEFTGLRSRVVKAGDYVLGKGIGNLGNLGAEIVWGDAPWNKEDSNAS